MTEIWKDVEGWEGLYKVSNTGRVKSLQLRKGILKPFMTPDGYLRIGLYDGKNKRRKTILVHRLVARAFLPSPPKKLKVEINHVDGDKENNYVENLEWVTHADNMRHAYKNKLIPNGRTRGVSVVAYNSDLQLVGTFDAISIASEKLGIGRGGIWRSCNSSYLKAGGYKWEYATWNSTK